MHRVNRKGWSLLELAIVITIIGILVAVAVPFFRIMVKKSRLNTLSNDLRIHSNAIQRFTMDVGYFPQNFSTTPTFMEGYLSASWNEPSPIGGRYSWSFVEGESGGKGVAFIDLVPTITHPFMVTYTDIVSLDREMDDGNVGSGYLRVAGNRIRYYLSLPE